MLFRYLKTSGITTKGGRQRKRERRATVNPFSALTGADCDSGEWELLYQRCCSSGVCVLCFSTYNRHFPKAPPRLPFARSQTLQRTVQKASCKRRDEKAPNCLYLSSVRNPVALFTSCFKRSSPLLPGCFRTPTIVSRLFVLSNLLTLLTRQHPQRWRNTGS